MLAVLSINLGEMDLPQIAIMNATSSSMDADWTTQQERAKAIQGKGKLGRQLDAQKAQTQYGTLAAASQESRAARDADAVTEARNYN